MPLSTAFDDPPGYDTRDRVVTNERIGPVWHLRPNLLAIDDDWQL